MAEINEIRIVDELRKCIESFDEETRQIFDFYCLGKRFNNTTTPYDTLDDYLKKVEKALKEQNNLGHRFVVFKSLNNNHNLIERVYWSRESPSYYNYDIRGLILRYTNNSTHSWSCFATKGNVKSTFKFDFKNLNANCCIVFLIHPSVASYDGDELATFASKWDEWFHKIIDIYPTPKFKFYFGNYKNIFSGDAPPTHQEVKKNKINVAFDLPVKSYAYEKF